MFDEIWLKDKVRKLMYENLTQGYSELLQKEYCYIMPAADRYPFQWFWDTFFHVYILCAIDEYDIAKKNLLSLFAMQERNGFVGHMIFWKQTLPVHIFDVLQARPRLNQLRPHMSSLIQPTLAAQATLKLFTCTQDKGLVLVMLPKLKAYHSWLKANRDIHGDGLISIISPFESGLDYKPSYDQLVGFSGKGNFRLGMKNRLIDWRNFLHGYNLPKIFKYNYFQVKDVLVNTIYALDLQALADLCRILNLENDARNYEAQAEITAKSILRLMYDEKDCAFYDVFGKKNEKLKRLTLSIFFPLVLPQTPSSISEKIVETHLLKKDKFAAPFPIPSLAINDVAFDPKESPYLWRGPTWVLSNWFLFKCLKKHGFEAEAINLRQTILKLIQKSGFREYYDPFTGEGAGAKNFTWSGLIVDMF